MTAVRLLRRLTPQKCALVESNSQTNLHVEAEAARVECEQEGSRREQAQRRRKSRHTQSCEAPVPRPAVHRLQRQTAAGDQNQPPLKRCPREVLLPLRPPHDGDPYVNTGMVSKARIHHRHESGLRMPLFDGGDWAGFMSQFEACINYYGWTEKTKTIRLYTSIVGEARKTLGAVNANTWTYTQLKKHMEVRYGRSKVYAQIQSELLSLLRKPGQTLHAYYDELVAASYTANIPEGKRVELIHTAFVFGLRGNQHMHRWVTKRERGSTIEAALEAAEAYEDEYGSAPVLQSTPISVNSRDATGNPLAVALYGCEQSEMQGNNVSVDVVQAEGSDTSLKTFFAGEMKQFRSHINKKFDTLGERLDSVEKWQANQIKRWKESAEKRKKFRDNNRAKNHNKKKNQSKNQNDDSDGGHDEKQGSKNKKNQSHKNEESEINTRAAAAQDSVGSED